MIEAYQKYHAAGFSCIPTSKIKAPAVPKGSKLNGNWEVLEDYKKAHGIGLWCGEVSGGLECLDFDNHFGDAVKIFSEFMVTPGVSEIYEKYAFPVQSTVSGGFHLIYKCTLVNGSEKLASRLDSKGEPDAIIESRGKGNYFVVDPSPGYKIKLNDIFNIPTISPEERSVLFSVARSFNAVSKPYKTEEPKASDLYNNTPGAVSEMTSALEGAGWVEVEPGKWRRPGKDRNISATLGICGEGLFYNFSSNGSPFELNYVYNAFQVVALLKYHGDYKAFAKEIYEKQNPTKKTEVKPLAQVSDDQVYADLEKRFRVDLTIEPLPAPAILHIKEGNKLIPLLTLQNISLIIGKARSRKTFLTVLLSASFLGFLNELIQADPERKGIVMVADTEQSPHDLHVMMKRICRLIGDENPERLQAYGLKTMTPQEKIDFIDYKIRTTPELTMVIIDGIRDLVFDINSPEEATKISVRLMKWAAEYNIHILNVLHQNKGDANARGHLGTELVNKSERVLCVNKDEDTTISTISDEYPRGMEIKPFSFSLDDDLLPVLCNTPEKAPDRKRIPTPNQVSDERHYQVLDKVYKNITDLPTHNELTELIVEGFDFSFGESNSKKYIRYYLTKGWITKERDNHKMIYKYERATF